MAKAKEEVQEVDLLEEEVAEELEDEEEPKPFKTKYDYPEEIAEDKRAKSRYRRFIRGGATPEEALKKVLNPKTAENGEGRTRIDYPEDVTTKAEKARYRRKLRDAAKGKGSEAEEGAANAPCIQVEE